MVCTACTRQFCYCTSYAAVLTVFTIMLCQCVQYHTNPLTGCTSLWKVELLLCEQQGRSKETKLPPSSQKPPPNTPFASSTHPMVGPPCVHRSTRPPHVPPPPRILPHWKYGSSGNLCESRFPSLRPTPPPSAHPPPLWPPPLSVRHSPLGGPPMCPPIGPPGPPIGGPPIGGPPGGPGLKGGPGGPPGGPGRGCPRSIRSRSAFARRWAKSGWWGSTPAPPDGAESAGRRASTGKIHRWCKYVLHTECM